MEKERGLERHFLLDKIPPRTLRNTGCARGVMVIVAGIGHSDMSSNPGLIAFHIALIPLGKV